MLVTLFAPTDTGHGGNHRAYQLKRDVAEAMGAGCVTEVCFTEWRTAYRASHRSVSAVRRLLRNVGGHLRRRVENPLRCLHDSGISHPQLSDPEFLRHYEARVNEGEPPTACILEHAGFAGVIAVNRRHGIATIASPQNIEALDGWPLSDNRWALRAAMYDLANEVSVFSLCEQRFLISKVEAGFYEGMGYESQYYPYRPVGAIAQRHAHLRERRCARKGKSGRLLLLGTAGHKTTREGMLWFMEQCRTHGLPDGIKITVCGAKADKHLAAGKRVPGIEVHGWVEQAIFDELLVQADAVLCPQRRGFGALTKLPELACAGIPVIVPRCVSYAMELPPGVHVVDDRWGSWVEAMQRIQEDASVSLLDYSRWHERQQPTMAQAIGRMRNLG